MAAPKLDEAAIFNAARLIPVADAREQFVRLACGDDLAMRARVEALLGVHDRELTALESPAFTTEAPPDTIRPPSTLTPVTTFPNRLRATVLTLAAVVIAIVFGAVVVAWLAGGGNDAGLDELEAEQTTASLESMKDLANSYLAADRLDEAVKLKEEIAAILNAKLGPNDPETLASMSDLAAGYSYQHRFSEALSLNQELFNRLKAVRGPTNPDTLASMGNLARSYSDLGRDEDARKLKQELLTLQKASIGIRPTDTIQTMYSLATTDLKLGRYSEALKLHQEVLELRREKFGPDNFQTLLSMRGFAISLAKLQRTAEAIPIIDECLKVAAGKKFRSDFFDLADIRLRYFEKRKDVAGCRIAAELFENIPPTTAVGFYHATCNRAVTAGVILTTDKSPEGEKQARAEADRAMAWLQKAIDAGFKDIASLRNDNDLAPLRGRSDFERLIAKLEAGVKK